MRARLTGPPLFYEVTSDAIVGCKHLAETKHYSHAIRILDGE